MAQPKTLNRRIGTPLTATVAVELIAVTVTLALLEPLVPPQASAYRA